jgi:hypothetical protein
MADINGGASLGSLNANALHPILVGADNYGDATTGDTFTGADAGGGKFCGGTTVLCGPNGSNVPAAVVVVGIVSDSFKDEFAAAFTVSSFCTCDTPGSNFANATANSASAWDATVPFRMAVRPCMATWTAIGKLVVERRRK